jgi:hypothetical protein
MLTKLSVVSISASTLRRKRVQPQYSIWAYAVCSRTALPALPAGCETRGTYLESRISLQPVSKEPQLTIPVITLISSLAASPKGHAESDRVIGHYGKTGLWIVARHVAGNGDNLERRAIYNGVPSYNRATTR